MIENTIIDAAFEAGPHLRSLITELPESPGSDDMGASLRLFKIRAASTDGRRSSANILIQRRYAWRGYETSPAPFEQQGLDRMTLIASDGDTTIGTMSVGFDGPGGLLVEDLFPAEVNALRAAGCRVCEFTKLAVDVALSSKRVLASLFHVAYIFAYRVMKFDRLLIEINPRHVKYYERILGFKAIGPQRINQRVNAPAVLMCLDFAHTEAQIGKFGGRPQLSATERSLYPYSFSVEEEAGIVARMTGATRSRLSGEPLRHSLLPRVS